MSQLNCPECGATGVPIAYGLLPAPENNEYIMGGCIISEGSADYGCLADGCATVMPIGNSTIDGLEIENTKEWRYANVHWRSDGEQIKNWWEE